MGKECKMRVREDWEREWMKKRRGEEDKTKEGGRVGSKENEKRREREWQMRKREKEGK